MSVLMCPVCQGPMREINRDGVHIDTCTRCRGVWLDRGELEKLSGLVGERDQTNVMPNQARYDEVRRTHDDDDNDRREHGGRHRQKSKVSRFLDFFD